MHPSPLPQAEPRQESARRLGGNDENGPPGNPDDLFRDGAEGVRSAALIDELVVLP
jgi:hypothetical protein